MFATVLAFIGVISETIDFLVKAVAMYSDTTEGAQDWQDVLHNLEDLGLYDPTDLPEQPAQGSQDFGGNADFSMGHLRKLSAQFEEQQSQEAAAPRVVREPRKHAKSGARK